MHDVVLPQEVAAKAHEHAAVLLTTLQETHAGRAILARDAKAVYLALCAKKGWKPTRWLSKPGVSHALRLVSGNLKKVYVDVPSDTPSSKRQRWLAYVIPARSSRSTQEAKA